MLRIDFRHKTEPELGMMNHLSAQTYAARTLQLLEDHYTVMGKKQIE